MNPVHIVLTGGTALLMAAANLAMKAGMTRLGPVTISRQTGRALLLQPLLLLGVSLVGLAALVWLYLLSREPMSRLYPVFVGMTYVLIVLGAAIILRESVPVGRIVGIALVLCGTLLLTR